MRSVYGLMFLQGYVATPAALATIAPDLVDQVADAIQTGRGVPRPLMPAAVGEHEAVAC